MAVQSDDDARPREVGRIHAHLARVERELKAQTPAGLTFDQLERRAIVIDNLHAYIAAERYPTNRTKSESTPSSSTRTACAARWRPFWRRVGSTSWSNESPQPTTTPTSKK
ncbi:hypothetical protein LVJ94_33065 [Pendulispora rubella]|uniref:Uncharacterized protein n=1 Tax=Pendulispora rubella TaxID=2741070 RepID=A0ABZ2KSU5_9BACT